MLDGVRLDAVSSSFFVWARPLRFAWGRAIRSYHTCALRAWYGFAAASIPRAWR